MNHQGYTSSLLYAEDVDTPMAKEIKAAFSHHKAATGSFGSSYYGKFRKLSGNDQKQALEYIRKVNPDVIHVHYGVDFLTFAPILRKVNIPVVVSFYGYDCTSFPKRFKGLGQIWLQKRVFSHPTLKAVFAMSPDMQKDLLSIGCPTELIKVHYYGSDCIKFSGKREYQEKDSLHFSIISGLAEKKGHFVLLEAWKLLMNLTDKKISLSIYGSGELGPQIEEAARQIPLADIRMEGALNYGSTAHIEALRKADIFVHPSITAANGDKEGIPGALVEAMASGLPVISTYHAGIPYIIQNEENGLLVNEKDSTALANAMARLCNEPGLREKLGLKAQEHSLHNLDLVPKEKELEALYDQYLR